MTLIYIVIFQTFDFVKFLNIILSIYYLNDINMASITLRIDDKLKKTLQAMAKQLGLSLNQLINLQLHQFSKDPKLDLKLNDMVFWIDEDHKFYKWEIINDLDPRFYEWEEFLEIEDQEEFLKVLDKLTEEDKKEDKKKAKKQLQTA